MSTTSRLAALHARVKAADDALRKAMKLRQGLACLDGKGRVLVSVSLRWRESGPYPEWDSADLEIPLATMRPLIEARIAEFEAEAERIAGRGEDNER